MREGAEGRRECGPAGIQMPRGGLQNVAGGGGIQSMPLQPGSTLLQKPLAYTQKCLRQVEMRGQRVW